MGRDRRARPLLRGVRPVPRALNAGEARLIDTHCHLDREEFDADRDEVLARAAAAGVTDLVVPAIGPDRWERLLAFCGERARVRGRPALHPALGIHPQLLPALDPSDDDRHLADLEAALGAHPVVAVGECGLDGGAVGAGVPMDRQVRILEAHLALAARFGLPVVLHGLHALDPLREVLERVGLPEGGAFHSYSGSADQVAPFVRLGLHLALAGPVTYHRARKPLEAARAIPRDRLLLETDAPDQCPRPHRGRNEPAYVALVRDGVARALGAPPDEVAAFTTANARRLFRLP